MKNYLSKSPDKARRCELCRFFEPGKQFAETRLANRCKNHGKNQNNWPVVAKGGTCNSFTPSQPAQ